jgi:hypothetical protein
MHGCIVSDNSAEFAIGGGVSVFNYLTPSKKMIANMYDCSFTGNSSMQGGGVSIFSAAALGIVKDTKVLFKNCKIEKNQAGAAGSDGQGGGVYVRASDSGGTSLVTVALDGCVVSGNEANGNSVTQSGGGGISVLRGIGDPRVTVNITGSTVNNNKVTQNGAGIGMGGGVYIGEFLVDCVFTLDEHSSITGNIAEHVGHAISTFTSLPPYIIHHRNGDIPLGQAIFVDTTISDTLWTPPYTVPGDFWED